MSSPARTLNTECIETNIPARLDRLPWSRWHLLVVVALGITWLLDGLESNLAGSLAGILKRRDTLALTDAQFALHLERVLQDAVRRCSPRLVIILASVMIGAESFILYSGA